jgi:hypothetical protein
MSAGETSAPYGSRRCAWMSQIVILPWAQRELIFSSKPSSRRCPFFTPWGSPPWISQPEPAAAVSPGGHAGACPPAARPDPPRALPVMPNGGHPRARSGFRPPRGAPARRIAGARARRDTGSCERHPAFDRTGRGGLAPHGKARTPGVAPRCHPRGHTLSRSTLTIHSQARSPKRPARYAQRSAMTRVFAR